MGEDDIKALQADREKNFAVEVPRFTSLGLEQAELKVTHNGHNWSAIALTRDEAASVIDALTREFAL